MKSSTLKCWVDLTNSSDFCGATGLQLHMKTQHDLLLVVSAATEKVEKEAPISHS